MNVNSGLLYMLIHSEFSWSRNKMHVNAQLNQKASGGVFRCYSGRTKSNTVTWYRNPIIKTLSYGLTLRYFNAQINPNHFNILHHIDFEFLKYQSFSKNRVDTTLRFSNSMHWCVSESTLLTSLSSISTFCWLTICAALLKLLKQLLQWSPEAQR